MDTDERDATNGADVWELFLGLMESYRRLFDRLGDTNTNGVPYWENW